MCTHDCILFGEGVILHCFCKSEDGRNVTCAFLVKILTLSNWIKFEWSLSFLLFVSERDFVDDKCGKRNVTTGTLIGANESCTGGSSCEGQKRLARMWKLPKGTHRTRACLSSGPQLLFISHGHHSATKHFSLSCLMSYLGKLFESRPAKIHILSRVQFSQFWHVFQPWSWTKLKNSWEYSCKIIWRLFVTGGYTCTWLNHFTTTHAPFRWANFVQT